VSEVYAGRQFVGMDLHRRRSVLVRMGETGEHLETVRILNDRDSLAVVMSRAGESPEVVLEATSGGTGPSMRSPSSVRPCIWRTRWG
jgi:fructoselysine-6-P-deglycase FrlB-like protein